jgi:hypothetical protein
MKTMNLKNRKVAFAGAMRMMMAAALLFAGCDKNGPEEAEETEVIDPVVASISAKWNISDPDSRYASFEFQTDGTYIVAEYVDASQAQKTMQLSASSLADVQLPASPFYRLTAGGNRPAVTRAADTRQMTLHVGNYAIQGTVIVLTDLGMIEQFAATADEFTFTFKPYGSLESVDYAATKSNTTVSDSKRTTLLCRMWEIEKIGINTGGMGSEMTQMYELLLGKDWEKGLESMLYEMVHFELDGRMVTLCGMFSRAGTYLSLFRDAEGNYFTEVSDGWFAMSTVIGEWKWLDAKESRIEWKQTGSFGMEGGEGVAEVTELSLTRLVLTGTTDAEGMEGFGIGYIEEFKAVK